MPQVRFTRNLARHVNVDSITVPAGTMRSVLDAVFAQNPQVAGYIIDEQGALRKHMSLFINGMQIRDRKHLSDPVAKDAVIDVIQALSGG